MNVSLDLQVRSVRAVSARWLTLTALSWAAAAAATILCFGIVVLVALGRDLDAWPVPTALGFSWMV